MMIRSRGGDFLYSQNELLVCKVHLGDAGVDNYVRSSVLVEDVRALREAIVAANRDDKPGVV
jgi:hypothetical protein